MTSNMFNSNLLQQALTMNTATTQEVPLMSVSSLDPIVMRNILFILSLTLNIVAFGQVDIVNYPPVYIAEDGCTTAEINIPIEHFGFVKGNLVQEYLVTPSAGPSYLKVDETGIPLDAMNSAFQIQSRDVGMSIEVLDTAQTTVSTSLDTAF